MRRWSELTDEERTAEAGYEEALLRIYEAKKNNKTRLSLNDLKLNAIPEKISELKILERLSVMENDIVDLSPLKSLENIEEIYLHYNSIRICLLLLI